MHDPQRMNLNNVVDPLTFILVSLQGLIFLFFNEI